MVGAADEIAPFDNAAFEKKTGELIGRSARQDHMKGGGQSVGRRVRLGGGDTALFVACDLFDKIDDATPEVRVLEPHERFGERKPFARGEEVGHIGR